MAKEWALWLLSVAVASTMISHIRHPTSNAGIVKLEPPPRRLPERSTCEEGGVNGDEYNLPLHVAGLFIILSVSTLAWPEMDAHSPEAARKDRLILGSDSRSSVLPDSELAWKMRSTPLPSCLLICQHLFRCKLESKGIWID